MFAAFAHSCSFMAVPYNGLLQVNCLDMDPYMTELFGRGSREGLLHWVRDGTLVINNVHKVRHVRSTSANLDMLN